MLRDFNLLASTSRGNERPMCNELLYLLKEELGDNEVVVGKTGVRGLVAAKTTMNPVQVIEKFREILKERPYEFRFALRIIPIQQVLPTDLEQIKNAANELAKKIGEKESYRVTIEKRFTSLHSQEFIAAAASDIKRKVDLKNPDWVMLIEVLGGFTGLSLLKPNEILAVVREKMMPD